MADESLSDDALSKAFLTVIILALMVPGLFFEPGPLSEVVGFAAIGSVWGFDFGDVADVAGGGS